MGKTLLFSPGSRGSSFVSSFARLVRSDIVANCAATGREEFVRLNRAYDTLALREMGNKFLGVIVGAGDAWCPMWQVKILANEFSGALVSLSGCRLAGACDALETQ